MTSNAMYRDNFWREMEYENFQCHPGALPAAETSPVKHPEPAAGSSNTGFPCSRGWPFHPDNSTLMKILVPSEGAGHRRMSFQVATHTAGLIAGPVAPVHPHVRIS